jgi:hypothetical protein
MNCTENGVGFTAAEIRCLLKFASKEDADRNKRGVQIVVHGDRVWARATNGVNSLELDGVSDGQLPNGEWFVDRGFLEMAVKLVVGVKAVLRLAFSGASLHRAIREENEVEIGSLEVPAEAAIADVSFPWNKAELKTPARNRTIAHCSALPGAYSALLQDVEDALSVEYSDLYPPPDPDHPWVFVVNDSGQTSGRGTLKCALSAAATAGDGNDETEEDDAPKNGKRKPSRKSRQQELATS